jgi:hypothetical protein
MMDFGTLKNIFTKILIESHIKGDKKGKELYKKYLKIIRENEALRSHFIVYKNIETKTIGSDVEASNYLKENLSLLKKQNLKEGKIKLVNLLKKYGYKLNEKPSTLHESLNVLLTKRKNVETINEIHESFEVVKNWLTSPKNLNESSNNNKNKVDVNKFLKVVTKKYNEKYSNISEEEKKVIKTILSNNDTEKESLLKNMVKESIVLINKSLKEYGDNINIKSKLLEAKDIVYNLEFNKETFKDDILKVYELKNNLN